MLNLNFFFPVVVSPLAYLSKSAIVGDGTIIMHKAIVNAKAKIGKNCIINTGAIIEHDVVIGDNCHISTGSIVNGGAQIGNNTFIGSGSVIKQNIKLGSGSLINAKKFIDKDLKNSQKFCDKKTKTTIIAEAGVNHNGNIHLAYKLVDIAAKSKADYVKFQTFVTEDLVQKKIGLAKYQRENSKKINSQYNLLKKFELSELDHKKIIQRCKKRIKFISSPFDLKSIDLLKN